MGISEPHTQRKIRLGHTYAGDGTVVCWTAVKVEESESGHCQGDALFERRAGDFVYRDDAGHVMNVTAEDVFRRVMIYSQMHEVQLVSVCGRELLCILP